jgi:D-alanyl-D-alanine carboxypeptidase/D-alanyl-D-alanine-endopeptidase (penicillin-binding protein 4)
LSLSSRLPFLPPRATSLAAFRALGLSAFVAASVALAPDAAAAAPGRDIAPGPGLHASAETALQTAKRRAPTRKSTASSRKRTTTRRTARPAVAAAPAVRATTPRSASALTSDLAAMLDRRTGSGRWGAMVVSLTRGDTLFARNADAPLTPASTMKLFTAALALERLGPTWRYSTDVLRDAPVAADGSVQGNLYLRGDGDPSLSGRYLGRDPDAPMTVLASQVAGAGVRRITGDLVADATAFESRLIPEGWPARNLGSAYSAPFSALSINENIVWVAVHPDGHVTLEPASSVVPILDNVRTVGGSGASLSVRRRGDGQIEARGSIGTRSPVRRYSLIIDNPPLFTAGSLRSALAARGVTVDGQVRLGSTPANAERVASLVSPPLERLVAAMNRESINIYAELLFRSAVRGAERKQVGSAELGNATLKLFATEKLGADESQLYAADGSGLSTLDRITSRAMIHLLGYGHEAPWASAFHASLPVAGESELLRNRMRGTPAQGNLHAKTGTTNEVIGLSGYVTAENGEVLAFSFIFNGADRWNARATIDAMGVTLAGFSR